MASNSRLLTTKAVVQRENLPRLKNVKLFKNEVKLKLIVVSVSCGTDI